MNEFITDLRLNYTNMSKIFFFNYFKTGNTIIDAVLSSIIITIFGYIMNNLYDFNLYKLYNDYFLNIKSLFYKKNTIIIEGKKCSTTSTYTSAYCVSSLYSNRFKAILNYIITNIDNIKSIYQIKETYSNFESGEIGEGRRKKFDIFMVFQNNNFKIAENIFIKAQTEEEETQNEKDKVSSKIDKITIKIYSYVYSIGYLIKFVDDITEKYLNSIKEFRSNKRFIYFLEKIKNDNEDSKYGCWREDLFETSKTFNNIFFDGKKELIEKIDFFIKNREWYYEKGIPYSLGIGLSGPPGTGKTSFIKALAKYTNRHVIQISLKLIKTKQQLEHFFFENTYNENNEKNSITFDNKIIVFEDIDCIGDIILERKNKKQRNINFKKNINIDQVIQTICDNNNNNNNISTIGPNNFKDNPITLDDILNLWDGIRETPGRILVITSNYYEKLDDALIRPGRIDITHNFSNASHNTISEVFKHLFGKDIDNNKLKKIKEYLYSPAELVNIYVSNKTEEDFVNRLIENKTIIKK